MGIGLYLVRRLLALLGGEVTIGSKLGERRGPFGCLSIPRTSLTDRGNAVTGLGIAVTTKKAKKGLHGGIPASNSCHTVRSPTVAAPELPRRAAEHLFQRG